MFKNAFVIAAFVCAVTAATSQTVPPSCSNMTLGTNGALNGFVPSPNDAWHQDISTSPVDPNSTKILTAAADLNSAKLHPDFTSIAAGGYGIPYTVVDSSTTPNVALPITLYASESDITVMPIPANLAVESSPAQCVTSGGDRHALILDRNKCVAYELYQAAQCNGAWSASDDAIWDMAKTEQRPYGYTSADAAGLSIFEGLIRYDEIVAGVINHAIRFTAQHTKSGPGTGYYTPPATHAAGNLSATDNIMGMRIRLQAGFDISKFSTTNQIILKAMKQYGMILADNGSNMFFQGTPDARWNDNDLSALKAIPSTAFEVVQMGPVYTDTTAPKGAAPQIVSFTASANNVAAGTAVTLTPNVTGATYSYIDKTGFTRGPITVTPAATTTYTLTSRNVYGSSSASVTVTVGSGTGTGTGTGTTKPNLAFVANYGQTFGVAPFAVTATSNSAGAIAYSIASGPATIAGNMVTLTGTGTVVVRASQAATSTYAAGTATLSFAVKPGSPSLAFAAIPDLNYGTAPFALAVTTKSAGSISYTIVGPATLAGNMVTPTGLGKVVVNATEAASGNYAAASASTSFHVLAEPVTITIAPIPTQQVGNPAFTVSATSNSPAAITWAVLSGPAMVSGSSVKVTGAGTVSLRARQVGVGNYQAGTATVSFTVIP